MDFNLLAFIWAAIIAFAVLAYVVLDGFDLGVGILFPFLKEEKERDLMMNSVAPIWDGNETWLVLGGGGLLAVFPLAYATILPALYAPIIAMLLGLVLRGVAFEARWRDPGHRKWWDIAFTAGSLAAALAQGITLGALLQGVEVANRAYAGGWLDWLTPFTLLTGGSLACGYAMLGACWLIWKTEGGTQDHAFRLAGRFAVLTLLAIVAIGLATLSLEQDYRGKWLSSPAIFVTAQVPLIIAIVAYAFYRSLKARRQGWPFLLALGLFLLTFAGLGISMFPDIVPGALTIWDAAAPERSQVFMLVGAAVLMPIILAYTGWSYWVFRGKVDTEGYH